MGAQAVRQHQRRVAVVHRAGLGGAIFTGDEQAHVGFQAAGPHRAIIDQTIEILAVQASEFGMVVLEGQLRRPGVVAAKEGEAV
ncbi:hypothetical protein D3C76_1073450 [compost metagenome]